MKLTEEIESNGIFSIGQDTFQGRIKFSIDRPVEIVVTSDFLIADISIGTKRLPIVTGVIRDLSKKVTLLDPLIFQSHMSSHGIVEYTVRANVAVVGNSSLESNEFSIRNFHLLSPELTKYIGNSLLVGTHNYNEKSSTLQIKFDEVLSSFESSDHTISIKAFYNYQNYDLRRKFSIEQINSIVFGFPSEVPIYEAIQLVKKVDNFLSFIFQHESHIDEVVNYYHESTSDRDVELFRHIYFRNRSAVVERFDDSKYLYASPMLAGSFGVFLSKWLELSENVPYLNHFFLLYNGTKYIDQKIAAQVNLIEALHDFLYGVKKDDTEVQQLVERIVPQIAASDDKDLIENLLRTKNGIGLRRKLREACTIVGGSLSSKQIDSIIAVRSSLAHGRIQTSITFDEQIEFNEALQSILIELLKKQIERA